MEALTHLECLLSFYCAPGIVLGARDIGGEKSGRKSLPCGSDSPVRSGFSQRNDVGASTWTLEDFLEEMLPKLSLKGSGNPVTGMKVGWDGNGVGGSEMEEGRSRGGMEIGHKGEMEQRRNRVEWSRR